MTWWLRVHRTMVLLGLTVTLTLLSLGLGPIGMLFPSFGGGAPIAMIPVAAVAPLVIAIAAGASIIRAPSPAPTRRTDLLELSTVLVVIGLVCAIGTLGLALGADPPGRTTVQVRVRRSSSEQKTSSPPRRLDVFCSLNAPAPAAQPPDHL